MSGWLVWAAVDAFLQIIVRKQAFHAVLPFVGLTIRGNADLHVRGFLDGRAGGKFKGWRGVLRWVLVLGFVVLLEHTTKVIL